MRLDCIKARVTKQKPTCPSSFLFTCTNQQSKVKLCIFGLRVDKARVDKDPGVLFLLARGEPTLCDTFVATCMHQREGDLDARTIRYVQILTELGEVTIDISEWNRQICSNSGI